MKWLAKFVKEDSGATAVEYGILVAAVSAIIVAVVITLGGTVSNSFSTVSSEVATIPSP